MPYMSRVDPARCKYWVGLSTENESFLYMLGLDCVILCRYVARELNKINVVCECLRSLQDFRVHFMRAVNN